MAITREKFEDELFMRGSGTKKQSLFIEFFLNNKDTAYTTREVSKSLFGEDDHVHILRANAMLKRLEKNGVVLKKATYWILNVKNEIITEDEKEM